MATIHREGNVELLSGKIAVLGYGSQGHAHALNLRDSGVEVEVGLREGSSSRAAAEEAGLGVGTPAEVVRGAQIVAFLLPDQVEAFEELVRPYGVRELVRTGRVGLRRPSAAGRSATASVNV